MKEMNQRFDELTKNLAQAATQRAAQTNFGPALAGMVLACFTLASSANAGNPSYTTVDYPRSIWTAATEINSSGQIVGRYIDIAGTSHGFLLSRVRFFDITPPGAIYSRAAGINRNGDIVGDYSASDPKGGKDVHGYL